MIKRASEVGLNYLAISDHNYVTSVDKDKAFDKYRVCLVDAFELSTNRAHVLVLGIKSEIANPVIKKWDFVSNNCKPKIKKEKLEDMLSWAVDHGAYNIVAHPFMWGNTKLKVCMPLDYLHELYHRGLVHGAEEHNHQLEYTLSENFISRMTYRKMHRKTSHFLKDHNIPSFANSDAHRPEILGGRFNLLEISYNNDPEKLLSDLREKRINITHGKNNIRNAI